MESVQLQKRETFEIVASSLCNYVCMTNSICYCVVVCVVLLVTTNNTCIIVNSLSSIILRSPYSYRSGQKVRIELNRLESSESW